VATAVTRLYITAVLKTFTKIAQSLENKKINNKINNKIPIIHSISQQNFRTLKPSKSTTSYELSIYSVFITGSDQEGERYARHGAS
jgi:hypothetical protein